MSTYITKIHAVKYLSSGIAADDLGHDVPDTSIIYTINIILAESASCLAVSSRLWSVHNEERRLELCALATHQTPVIAKTGFNSAPLRSLKPICATTTHCIDDNFGV